MAIIAEIENRTVEAFGKQAFHYDADENTNPVLPLWRQRVYHHVEQFLKPESSILELNAGTGIDALHFVRNGHHVHATDAAPQMIGEIQKKITIENSPGFSCQCLSYDRLDSLTKKYDYIFSNFGGLNCTSDLLSITRHLPGILNPGGFVTMVIMPPKAPWEWMWLLKGLPQQAFRRFKNDGTDAHLEGHHFMTWYYSLSQVRGAMGEQFLLRKCEGIGAIAPPPSATHFVSQHPRIHQTLQQIDKRLAHFYPFNRWADHLIITFQKR